MPGFKDFISHSLTARYNLTPCYITFFRSWLSLSWLINSPNVTESPRFIAVFTVSCRQGLSWAKWIQSTQCCMYVKVQLTARYHLLIHRSFTWSNFFRISSLLDAFVITSVRARCPVYPILLCLIMNYTWWRTHSLILLTYRFLCYSLCLLPSIKYSSQLLFLESSSPYSCMLFFTGWVVRSKLFIFISSSTSSGKPKKNTNTILKNASFCQCCNKLSTGADKCFNCSCISATFSHWRHIILSDRQIQASF